MADGGIGVVAPQGEREGFLGEPKGVLQMVVKRAGMEGVDQFGLTFMACDVGDITGQAGGHHFRRHCKVGIGPTFTLEEALAQAGGLGKLDKWAFDVLAQIAPSGYAADWKRKRGLS